MITSENMLKLIREVSMSVTKCVDRVCQANKEGAYLLSDLLPDDFNTKIYEMGSTMELSCPVKGSPLAFVSDMMEELKRCEV